MEAISSKVTSKGQVVIPKRLRVKYRIRSATAIRWIEKDQGILMVPKSNVVKVIDRLKLFSPPGLGLNFSARRSD